MDINIASDGAVATIVLSGRLDTASSPKLQEQLLPLFAAHKCVKLDIGGVAYVSSAGLRVLLMGAKAAKSSGVMQIVTGVSAEIMEVFEMTGFSDILTIE